MQQKEMKVKHSDSRGKYWKSKEMYETILKWNQNYRNGFFQLQ